MQIAFTLPGKLKGKGRGRAFAYRSKKTGAMAIGVHTPEATRKFEDLLRFYAREAMAGKALLQGPLFLTVQCYQHHPASWSKKKKAATKYVTGKPDCDNQIKTFDSVNQVVWQDDSQIAELTFQRRYVAPESPEQVHITVGELA